MLTTASSTSVISEALGFYASFLKLLVWPALANILLALMLLARRAPAWFTQFIDHLNEAYEYWVKEQFLEGFAMEVQQCDTSDSIPLDEISSKAFGPQSSTRAEIENLMRLDNEIFWKVVRVPSVEKSSSTEDIRGYYAIIRLSAKGEAAVLAGSFHGRSPDPNHVRTDKRRYPNIYVAAVYGRGTRDRACALVALNTHLRTIRAKKTYAKAATKDGLRLLKRYGFLPLPNQPAAIGSMFCRASHHHPNPAHSPTKSKLPT